MTHEEQISMYVANCQICTLADAMKNCQICKFNIGLAQKIKTEWEAKYKCKLDDKEFTRWTELSTGVEGFMAILIFNRMLQEPERATKIEVMK